MRAALMIGIAAALPFVAPAWADFVITSPPPPQDSLPSAAPDPAPAPEQATSTRHVYRRPAPPRFATAIGFGDQVPLSFAVKQIVPPAVKVAFGPGADPAALVNWQGGAAWNQVLAHAVRPLGLHLVMTWMAVEIRK